MQPYSLVTLVNYWLEDIFGGLNVFWESVLLYNLRTGFMCTQISEYLKWHSYKNHELFFQLKPLKVFTLDLVEWVIGMILVAW